MKLPFFSLCLTMVLFIFPLKIKASNSVLSSGAWHKVSISEDGVYKIDFNFLKTKLKVKPQNVRFDQFGVFGKAMGVLPELSGTARVADLEEIAIKIKDLNSNGIWDSEDYILFFGKGPHLWHYNNSTQQFSHTINVYSDKASYFISTNKGSGKSIPTETLSGAGSGNITTFDGWQLYEQEKNNLLYVASKKGMGRKWYGNTLSNVSPTESFSFEIPQLVSSSAIKVQARFAAASLNTSANFTIKNNGSQIFNVGLSGTNESSNYPDVATLGQYKGTFNSSSSTLNFEVGFRSNNPQAKGWIDYIEILAQQRLSMSNTFLQFRNFSSLNQAISKYSISNANAHTEVWNVTEAWNIQKAQGNLAGSIYQFSSHSTELKEFVAVNTSSTAFATPTYEESIANQNLRALPNTDYIIVTPTEFKDAAIKLANFHRQKSGLSVHVVLINQIYNEFSSGQQDISAIRDFFKMFYDRNATASTKFKYALLLGDASFDYKDRIDNNSNFIPTFESDTSLSEGESYCTDDYFAFLDDNEGNNMESSSITLDIAVGRIPAKTLAEATGVVDKIIHYKTQKSTNGWKNEITFVADDEDSNTHINDAEEIISSAALESLGYYNIDKIYIDAFKQQNAAGGDRYPDVVDAILRKLFTGTFFIDYTGHGGPTNWAQERIFNIQDIRTLKNKDKLPLFMTATCDFSPFDDASIVSAGEELILNPNGGAIAMLSTTRLVYAYSNKQMNKAVLRYLFSDIDGRKPTIGEVLQQAKNIAGGTPENNRKFVLLGDPALTLEYPKYEVVTTKINGKPISAIDTLKALSKVKIEGGIMDNNGALMTNFNGIIYTKVFDKKTTYRTRKNDPSSNVKEFKIRNNAIFQGKSTVKDGLFSVEFIVPKDINYSFGNGKITYYAEATDQPSINANGYTFQFKVGGTAPNFTPDDKGPQVQVYMNDTNFMFGGITNESPILLVKLKDESGINTIGNGIGHDLIGILDNNTQDQYLLNDYYQSALDDFTQGEIIYLLNNLAEGKHQIKVKAWDVHNNSGEGYTEFIVSSSAKLAIDKVLNFPNPFKNSTSFTFEHNQSGEDLIVKIEIFTLSGEKIKTIEQTIPTESYRIPAQTITWDGRNDSGNEISSGLYIYSVNVATAKGESVNKFEKLVILK